MTAPALFYKTAELAPRTQAYPLEEINDYLRACSRPVPRPCASTLAYYDLARLCAARRPRPRS